MFAVRGDHEVMNYWDWPPDRTPAETEAVIKQFLTETAAGEAHYWTLRLQSNGSFVGLCDFSEIDPNGSADLGFMLARRYWGQGLAAEAVTCLIAHARAIGLRTVRARIHAGNERSARLLIKTGFTEVAPLTPYEVRPGVHRDCRRFEIVL